MYVLNAGKTFRLLLYETYKESKDWQRTFYHPGTQKTTALFENAAIYSWHGNHHLRHIELAIQK